MKPAAALAAVFAAGALASRLLAGHTPAHFSIDRAQPVPVATAWGGFGMLTFLLLALTIGCAFLPYVLLLRRPPPLRITLATVVAVLVAGAWFTPLFSSDIYAYAAYGEMARTGLNPYLHHVLPASDRIFTAAAWQWPQLPACVYGEGFVAIARGISTLFAGAPVWVQLSAFRILAMAALPVCVALCGAIAKDERQRRFSGVFLTCNPIVIWSAIEGHNDALMIAAVLTAIAIARRFPFASIVTAASAVAIKLPALVAGVVIAARALANERRGMLPATILAIAIVLAAYARWSAGMRTALAPHGYFMPLASIAALPWSISSAIAPQTPLIAAGVTAIVVALATLVFASNAARYTGTDRYLLLALAGWILIPNPYPWYALWILPIAAFASDARLRRCALWVTGVALLRYVPDAVAVPALATNAAMGLIAAIPYVATLRSLKRGIISGSP